MIKHFVLSLIAAVILIAAAPAFAAPTGVPVQNLPQLSFSFSAGAAFAMRDIRVRANDSEGDLGFLSRLAVKGLFSPAKFLDVYGTIGTGNWRMTEPDFDSSLGLLFGGGFKFRVYPWPAMDEGVVNVEIDAQYLGMKLEGGDGEESGWRDQDITAIYEEWQVCLVVSGRFEFLVPYGGFCYDHMSVVFSPGGSHNVESTLDWGAFIGLDYFVTPLVYFSAELHVFTETSLYLGVGFAY